jgi:hypothetical protein
MIRTFVGTAFAVALLGSAAFAAQAPAAGGTTPTAATTSDTPTPPASLKCKTPKVPTQVKGKDGKMHWKCEAPATPATH